MKHQPHRLLELFKPQDSQRQRLAMPFSHFIRLNLSDDLFHESFSNLFVNAPILSMADDFAVICAGGEI